MSTAASTTKQIFTRLYRPPLFQQKVVLSDGSTYTRLTTSPRQSLRLTKDIRNATLYNPDAGKLLNKEENKRLSRFKGRFAGFEEENAAKKAGDAAASEQEEVDEMEYMVSKEARSAPKMSEREIKEAGNKKKKAKK